MTRLRAGLAVALLHLIIVSSLGAKLLYDRGHRPRVWVQVANYDPDLPIRGRYLSLNVEVPTEGITISKSPQSYAKDKDGTPVYWEHPVPYRCDLVLRKNVLTAVGNEQGEFPVFVRPQPDQPGVIVVDTRTPFFIPEHMDSPVPRIGGRQLWMEATIPRKGPPRPIRLAVKKDGALAPLAIN